MLTHKTLVQLKSTEVEILRENARELLVCLDDWLQAPQERALANGLRGVAQEVIEGVDRLVLLGEILDGLPPR